jgi:hypothetical protein
MVLEGTQWFLSLSHADRKLKCEGSNAYPGAETDPDPEVGPFSQFLRALETLTGKASLDEDNTDDDSACPP